METTDNWAGALGRNTDRPSLTLSQTDTQSPLSAATSLVVPLLTLLVICLLEQGL